jgi:hypothetical protein
MTIEKKEGLFEVYVDDLRFLGADIPKLYWDIDSDGDIYLLWDSINNELHKHLEYGDDYQSTLNRMVNYFNYSHKISDEDL